jgi:3,4-dihydroxy 2-butanone 4-phosphate synthase
MLSTQQSPAIHPPALPSGKAMPDAIEARFDPADMATRMAAALDAVRFGVPVVVLDDADRENEADLIIAADKLTLPGMAMLIRECSGIVCLCLTAEKSASLGLRRLVEILRW